MRIPLPLLVVVALLPSFASAAEPAAKIAWYGTLKQGLDEAKRSNRPILLVSAAPNCLGVSGIW